MNKIETETIEMFNETSEILKQLQNDNEYNENKEIDFLFEEVESDIQQNLEDQFVQDALSKNLDLRHYSKEVEKNLKSIETNSIQDYIKEAQNIANLHKQITSCDSILERIESMLNEFQINLCSISSEIQSLQHQSVNMNIKLKNRQAIRGELSQFIDEMVVSQSMIDNILDTPVTERAFLEQLHELNHKINFVKEQSFREAKACKDVSEVLDKLKIRAISKIRDFIMQKIYQLRKPMTNYEIIQNQLLKSRFFYEFLLSNERQISKECRDEYTNTLSKVYYSYFKEYSSKLSKLMYDEVADKDDLLGSEDKPRTSLFSSKLTMKNRSTIFTLGNRASILNDLETSIIIPHASLKADQKYSYECIFRSEQYALLDNSCREYLFLSDFFMIQDKQAQNVFSTLFFKILNFYEKHVETYMNSCYDAIAIFLCIHIIYKYEIISNKRGCCMLNKYYEAILTLLWSRFEYLMRNHINSIVEIDTHKFQTIDIRPHYITRRYAEFSSALCSINENHPNEKLTSILNQIQTEVQNFILKLASEFTQRKEQLILLINNYDLMLNLITEKVKEDSQEAINFKELLNARINEYVEEVLLPYFGHLIKFVKECEICIDKGDFDILKTYENSVTQLIRNFSSDWKKSLELINQEIMRTFTNFRNGQSILQATLTQLVQYYHRFQKVLSHNAFKHLTVRSEMLNIHHLMVEIKKHKPTF